MKKKVDLDDNQKENESPDDLVADMTIADSASALPVWVFNSTSDSGQMMNLLGKRVMKGFRALRLNSPV